MAPTGPFGTWEWCTRCGERPGDPKTDGLCEICLPKDRPTQLRNASARYRESVRQRLALVPEPGSTVLDPLQTFALADGLARLDRAVEAHREAVHALKVLGNDAMRQRVLDAQAAVVAVLADTLAEWEASLPSEVLPDRE